MSDKALKRRLFALQKKVDLIQVLMGFLKKHPIIVSYCTLKRLSTGTGLNFQEKCLIRPVWEGKPALRLDRYIAEFDDEPSKSWETVSSPYSVENSPQAPRVSNAQSEAWPAGCHRTSTQLGSPIGAAPHATTKVVAL
jgi:hypothetical protein